MKQANTQKKYNQLLIILLVNFVLSPFLRDNIGNIILSSLFLYAIIVIVRTFSLNKIFFSFYSTIAILAFCLSLIGRLGMSTSWTVAFSFFIQSIYIIYLTVAILLIARDIFLSETVSVDTIRGSICLYLLIGFVWGLMYSIVASINPQAFSQPLILEEPFGEAFYFSFTTLTTLGYGDILPVSPLARVLTNIEAIIGQLYPSILIAILVSDYLAQRKK
ncbi:MAG: ion channel [Cyanobacteria bacterium P01_C01_bin.72]